MPNLKDIRRRIESVQKTQQITRAMRMVAAAKLRRAEEAIVAARPYADRMRQTLGEVAAGMSLPEHPMLEQRDPVKRTEVVVVVSDRGLCGAFNANVIKRVESAIAERDSEREGVGLTLVGRKAIDHYRRRRPHQASKTFTHPARIDYGAAVDIAGHVAERFVSGEADEVLLVYSQFVSTMTQRPTVQQLLPVVPDAPDGEKSEESAPEKLPYEIEPNAARLLEVLVPRVLEVQIFRALLENQAGEHAARMTAMESATRNTEELIDKLKLDYNRARQAAITKELVEIVSGAEAL